MVVKVTPWISILNNAQPLWNFIYLNKGIIVPYTYMTYWSAQNNRRRHTKLKLWGQVNKFVEFLCVAKWQIFSKSILSKENLLLQCVGDYNIDLLQSETREQIQKYFDMFLIRLDLCVGGRLLDIDGWITTRGKGGVSNSIEDVYFEYTVYKVFNQHRWHSIWNIVFSMLSLAVRFS